MYSEVKTATIVVKMLSAMFSTTAITTTSIERSQILLRRLQKNRQTLEESWHSFITNECVGCKWIFVVPLERFDQVKLFLVLLLNYFLSSIFTIIYSNLKQKHQCANHYKFISCNYRVQSQKTQTFQQQMHADVHGWITTQISQMLETQSLSIACVLIKTNLSVFAVNVIKFLHNKSINHKVIIEYKMQFHCCKYSRNLLN